MLTADLHQRRVGTGSSSPSPSPSPSSASPSSPSPASNHGHFLHSNVVDHGDEFTLRTKINCRDAQQQQLSNNLRRSDVNSNNLLPSNSTSHICCKAASPTSPSSGFDFGTMRAMSSISNNNGRRRTRTEQVESCLSQPTSPTRFSNISNPGISVATTPSFHAHLSPTKNRASRRCNENLDNLSISRTASALLDSEFTNILRKRHRRPPPPPRMLTPQQQMQQLDAPCNCRECHIGGLKSFQLDTAATLGFAKGSPSSPASSPSSSTSPSSSASTLSTLAMKGTLSASILSKAGLSKKQKRCLSALNQQLKEVDVKIKARCLDGQEVEGDCRLSFQPSSREQPAHVSMAYAVVSEPSSRANSPEPFSSGGRYANGVGHFSEEQQSVPARSHRVGGMVGGDAMASRSYSASEYASSPSSPSRSFQYPQPPTASRHHVASAGDPVSERGLSMARDDSLWARMHRSSQPYSSSYSSSNGSFASTADSERFFDPTSPVSQAAHPNHVDNTFPSSFPHTTSNSTSANTSNATATNNNSNATNTDNNNATFPFTFSVFNNTTAAAVKNLAPGSLSSSPHPRTLMASVWRLFAFCLWFLLTLYIFFLSYVISIIVEACSGLPGMLNTLAGGIEQTGRLISGWAKWGVRIAGRLGNFYDDLVNPLVHQVFDTYIPRAMDRFNQIRAAATANANGQGSNSHPFMYTTHAGTAGMYQHPQQSTDESPLQTPLPDFGEDGGTVRRRRKDVRVPSSPLDVDGEQQEGGGGYFYGRDRQRWNRYDEDGGIEEPYYRAAAAAAAGYASYGFGYDGEEEEEEEDEEDDTCGRFGGGEGDDDARTAYEVFEGGLVGGDGDGRRFGRRVNVLGGGVGVPFRGGSLNDVRAGSGGVGAGSGLGQRHHCSDTDLRKVFVRMERRDLNAGVDVRALSASSGLKNGMLREPLGFHQPQPFGVLDGWDDEEEDDEDDGAFRGDLGHRRYAGGSGAGEDGDAATMVETCSLTDSSTISSPEVLEVGIGGMGGGRGVVG
ncbi:hypothetical protein HDU97_007953 [Phlyctochytrium planicorne]|nr:hypothetical protein HDU97_007953 [Phlyctochytrium planicorne]